MAREENPAAAGDYIVDVINPDGAGSFLLVCEHASSFIPERFAGLGLSREVQTSHAGWDPGALDVARRMSETLDAPLVAQSVSRLVYDCNRPLSAPSATPERSEIFDIPGNRNLSPQERHERAERYYFPFHRQLSERLDLMTQRTRVPVLITIHSFTPSYFGKQREVEIGILHDSDSRFADLLLSEIRSRNKMIVHRNEPYGSADGVTHTLLEHAIARGIPNVMVEIRNDLIASERQKDAISELLCSCATSALGTFLQRQE